LRRAIPQGWECSRSIIEPVERCLLTIEMRLRFWMEGDAVNVKRFRAGLPESWLIADKTGTGDFGVANDVGVVWTSRGTPLTIAVLTTKLTNDAANDEALVAGAAHQLARDLAPGE
jgi:beta-lactamase class A